MDFIINALEMSFLIILPFAIAFSLWSYIFIYIYKYLPTFNFSCIKKNYSISFFLTSICLLLFLIYSFLVLTNSIVSLIIGLFIALLIIFKIIFNNRYLYCMFLGQHIGMVIVTALLFKEITGNYGDVVSLIFYFYVIFCLFMSGICFFVSRNISDFNNGIYYIICIFLIWGCISLLVLLGMSYNTLLENILHNGWFIVCFIILLMVYSLIFTQNTILMTKRYVFAITFFFSYVIMLLFTYINYEYTIRQKYDYIGKNQSLMPDLSVIKEGVIFIASIILIYLIVGLIKYLKNYNRIGVNP